MRPHDPSRDRSCARPWVDLARRYEPLPVAEHETFGEARPPRPDLGRQARSHRRDQLSGVGLHPVVACQLTVEDVGRVRNRADYIRPESHTLCGVQDLAEVKPPLAATAWTRVKVSGVNGAPRSSGASGLIGHVDDTSVAACKPRRCASSTGRCSGRIGRLLLGLFGSSCSSVRRSGETSGTRVVTGGSSSGVVVAVVTSGAVGGGFSSVVDAAAAADSVVVAPGLSDVGAVVGGAVGSGGAVASPSESSSLHADEDDNR